MFRNWSVTNNNETKHVGVLNDIPTTKLMLWNIQPKRQILHVFIYFEQK